MYELPRGRARDQREDEPERETGGLAPGLGIEDLAEAANVPIRTIRYYIAEGLLPGPGSRGKLASYGEEHLARLRLIRRLVERRVPLAELRERIVPLTPGEVMTLLREEDQLADELRLAEQAASPKEYVSGLLKRARAAREQPVGQPASQAPIRYPRPSASSGPLVEGGLAPGASRGPVGSPVSARQAAEAWQRWELVPGVELHIRADAERRHRELIHRLLADTHAYQEER